MSTHLVRSLMLIAIACLITGCNQDPLPAKVRGTVLVDGQPLAKGTIIFVVSGKPEATGVIENGKIVSVGTFKTDDGASVGQAQVAVQAIQVTAAPAVLANPGETQNTLASMSGQSLLPARYGNPATSSLSADLKAGPNEPKFELQSK